MEASSQPLSIESFSYSWLVNLKPPFDGPDESDEASSFIEMDPRLPESRRFFRGSNDFKFDFPKSDSPLNLVDADELISNGLLRPIFAKMDSGEPEPCPEPPVPPSQAQKILRCSSLKKHKRFSKMILKYLDFLRPLCRKLRGRRSGSRIEAVETRMQEVDKWLCSPATSPRTSVEYSVDQWRRSCDSESSIYEAVLHCKRSIGRFEF
ncbi:hypothetical protein NMG60_11018061 [Bertholletia excelsa]